MPSENALEFIRGQEAFKREDHERRLIGNRDNLHGWSVTERPVFLTEPEIVAKAEEHDQALAEYKASPKARIREITAQLRDTGVLEEAIQIESAINRGILYTSHLINARACGDILKAISGLNTSSTRQIVQLVGENLRGLA